MLVSVSVRYFIIARTRTCHSLHGGGEDWFPKMHHWSHGQEEVWVQWGSIYGGLYLGASASGRGWADPGILWDTVINYSQVYTSIIIIFIIYFVSYIFHSSLRNFSVFTTIVVLVIV